MIILSVRLSKVHSNKLRYFSWLIQVLQTHKNERKQLSQFYPAGNASIDMFTLLHISDSFELIATRVVIVS